VTESCEIDICPFFLLRRFNNDGRMFCESGFLGGLHGTVNDGCVVVDIGWRWNDGSLVRKKMLGPENRMSTTMHIKCATILASCRMEEDS
jgi:hypothetical protein